uniref:Solute carrier family 26 member 5 n=1 Tax=Oryzias sinensis TaxID=183150 RepID=A0A8C8A434_9TELE
MEEEEAGAGEDAGSQLMCRIERPVYDEAFLRTQLLHRRENTTTFRQRLAEKFRCTSSKAKAVALTFLPFLTWLPTYPVKKYLLSDVVSGLSTSVVQLPQGLAYAMLAAVPPVYGLYSSFYPVVLYAFFGTSRHVSHGVGDTTAKNLAAVQMNGLSTEEQIPRPAHSVKELIALHRWGGGVNLSLAAQDNSSPKVQEEPFNTPFHFCEVICAEVCSQTQFLVSIIQELIALGLSNVFGSFFQTFAITSSMSRSLVQESTGGKTQIAGLVASLIVLLVIVAIGFVFEPLPQTVLAAIIMVNLLGMFRQFRDIPVLWRTSKIELVIWLATFVASVLLGLDYGLLAAIALALLTVIYRTQSPKTSILGHVPNTGLYYDVDEYEEASEYEGIKIFSSNFSIYFANSDLYVNTLKEKTGVNPEKLKAARKAREKQKKKSKESSPLTVAATVLSQSSQVEEGVNGHLEDEHSETTSEVVVFLEPLSDVHSIILDWTTNSFIDSVGAKAIKQVIREYAAVDVRVVIASCNRSTLADLDMLQFFSEDLTPHLFFPTIHDAVLHCQHARSSTAGAEKKLT